LYYISCIIVTIDCNFSAGCNFGSTFLSQQIYTQNRAHACIAPFILDVPLYSKSTAYAAPVDMPGPPAKAKNGNRNNGPLFST
jgi:hypothetical protein